MMSTYMKDSTQVNGYSEHNGRHKYVYELFNMGDGIYKACEICGYIPKRGNSEYWDFVKSGRVSCMVFNVGGR